MSELRELEQTLKKETGQSDEDTPPPQPEPAPLSQNVVCIHHLANEFAFDINTETNAR